MFYSPNTPAAPRRRMGIRDLARIVLETTVVNVERERKWGPIGNDVARARVRRSGRVQLSSRYGKTMATGKPLSRMCNGEKHDTVPCQPELRSDARWI